MATKSAAIVRGVTPAGVAVYPRLNRPDDKFNKDNPKYKLKLRLDPADDGVQEFLDKLTELAAISVAEAKTANPKAARTMIPQEPFMQDEDDEGNLTGFVLVSASTNSLFKDSNTGKTVATRPDVVDAKKRPVNMDQVNIGGGSVVRVAYKTNPYYVPGTKAAGVSLLLTAVQLLKLVAYSGSGADAFGTEDDGYEFDGDDAAPASDDTAASGAEAGGSGEEF